ncbi:MAG: FAD-dependent oxidoreductase [Candidatus Diapherotrites archaeon]|nr:FAD-dependent oxidoreductase [Candidatus Diapherotrites archaeon]
MKVPLLPLEERKTTFNEVEIGYNEAQALEEASRCLQCKKPSCVEGCPARVNIPGFIREFREGRMGDSAKIIRERNFFPSICGRICQHEKQCEAACVLAKKDGPVCIGGIERYIGDNAPKPKHKKANGKRVAIIGSGPSGLTAAAHVALAGLNATVFESTHAMGGIIKYGVPEFRLPKVVVTSELKYLQELGVDFEPNSKISEKSLEEISKKYDAIFIGTGVGKSRELKVPGSDLKGIFSAMKFLVNLNQSEIAPVKKGDKIVVVGAGYVGIDAARSAIRIGGEVTCITKESKEESIGRVAEKDYIEAGEEGVKFIFGAGILRFEGANGSGGGNGGGSGNSGGNGNTEGRAVKKVWYSTGQGECALDANLVIVAVGQEHDTDSFKQSLRTRADGCIKVNETYQTAIPNVFAAGDCIHGPKTVIEAVATGTGAAKAIIEYLEKNPKNKEEKRTEEQKKKFDEIARTIQEIDQSNADI